MPHGISLSVHYQKGKNDMICIKNEFLCAHIAERGAELKSLVSGKTEYIWQGDERFWSFSAPVMFPICSGLKDDEYLLDGKAYHLEKHGFARFKTFEVEKASADSATFLLRADDETRAQFPFDFALRITYSLSGKTLAVTYDVENESKTDMYFSIGAHEGYACPEGIEAYDIRFPEKETLISSVLDGNLLGKKTETVLMDDDTLPLDYRYFAVDALVFKRVLSKSVVLKQRGGSRAVKVTFEGFPYLLLWTKPDAPYICIEPWCGISDSTDTDGRLRAKEGINRLPANEHFVRTHTIEIL